MPRLVLLLLLSLLPLSAAGQVLPEVRRPADVARHFKPAKLHLVNLWATWCIPCVQEMSDLVAIDRTFSDSDLQMVGVSMDDAIPGDRAERKKMVQSFLTKRSVGFSNLYYIGRTPDIQEFYRFEGEIPLTMIYDSKGRELYRHQGRINRKEVTQKLQKLLRKGGK